MTSILDQYEQANRNAGANPAQFDREEPMFVKNKISFTPQFPVRHLKACSGRLAIALVNNMLLRIDPKTPEKINELDLAKYLGQGIKLSQLFLDPLGHHLFISLVGKENDSLSDFLYLHLSSNKPKPVSKAKNHFITAVGFNRLNKSATGTGPILLGTSKGVILEAEISHSEEGMFQSGCELSWKQVFDLGRGSPVAITGLEHYRLGGETDRHAVLVTTPTRLYQFVGPVQSEERPLLMQVFHTYLNLPERFVEIPSDSQTSSLQVFYQDLGSPATQFAWLTGAGVLLGNLEPCPSPGQDSITSRVRLIEDLAYLDPSLCHDTPKARKINTKTPLAIAVTEFHVLLLFYDRMRIVCAVNDQLVSEDYHDQSTGDMGGLIRDGQKGYLWTFADYAVFRYNVNRESRHVWKIYLKQGDYEKAKAYCGANKTYLGQVLLKEAEDLFGKKRYEESALLFAKTTASFEEVSLKFIGERQEDALITYFLEKCNSFKPTEQMQLTILVFWILELTLNQLNVLKEQGKKNDPLHSKKWNFLVSFTEQKRIADCIAANLNAVYNLLSYHGDNEVLSYFALKLKDYERVIEQHLLDKNYKAALKVLQQCKPELIYEHGPMLMQAEPRALVDLLIAQYPKLNINLLYTTLFAGLADNEVAQGKEAIRFLEFLTITKKSKDKFLHTFLFSLCAKFDPQKAVNYLNSQGTSLGTVLYDAEACLRLCVGLVNHSTDKTSESAQALAICCVLLYRLLGLYQDAVEVALPLDLALARSTADMPINDLELRKKLWLRIARHVVEEEKDVKRAMAVLHDCDLIKIEDVLPFFPDFVTIDLFKDAICSSLQDYNQHIEVLKEEMEEATKAADAIREDIQSFRNRHFLIEADQKCSLCSFPLLTRPCYIFPCGHAFHSVDCLIPELLKHLSPPRRERVQDLQRELASLPNKEDTDSVTTISARDQLLSDLDDVVASECLYCGEVMIRSIDAPFVAEDEYEGLAIEWR